MIEMTIMALACGAVIVAVAVMTIGAIVGRYWSNDDD